MLQGWENFYIMSGTAAATFAGLLFVVITLSVSLSSTPAARGVHAFVTPVLVHFGGVLFMSLVLLAPWQSAWPVGLILSFEGLGGIAYATFVIRLVRKLDFVSLDARDWIAYAGAPALANGCLLAGAAGLIAERSFAPYPIAGAVMLFLFVGMLDAWDMTLWIVRNRDAPQSIAIGGNARLRANEPVRDCTAHMTPDST
jgi:hypothetical protein